MAIRLSWGTMGMDQDRQTGLTKRRNGRGSSADISEASLNNPAPRSEMPVSPSSLNSKAGSRTEPLRLIRVAYYFLGRKQARKAWFIFVACVAAASVPWTAHWSEIRQGFIVLAGLAAGAIFLPELNSGLWRLNAKEIRDTIPLHRRRAFYLELIKADCPDNEWAQRWASLMWWQGVLPLLNAGRDGRNIRWGMTYDVTVHLNQQLQIDGDKRLMTRVETSIGGERTLPAAPDGMLCVSVCGNDGSLLSEFEEESCLSRELVALPGLSKQAWAAEIRKVCNIRVQIGPRMITFDPDEATLLPGDDDLRIMRWWVPLLPKEAEGIPVSCQIEMHFPIERHEKNFPVLFAGYYCAGGTVVSFKLYHGNGPRPVLRWRHAEAVRGSDPIGDLPSYFDGLATGGNGSIADYRPKRFDTADRQSVTYITPPDSLLWPGSGVYFWWDPVPE
jgi:hypothetical protein